MRYAKLDGLRGLNFISMALYHCLWDVNYIFGIHMAWYGGQPGRLWQQSICFIFILLSGFCSALIKDRETVSVNSRSELKGGLKVFICGAVVTAVTLIFMPDDRVIFGVLTLIGSCKLILWAFGNTSKHLPPLCVRTKPTSGSHLSDTPKKLSPYVGTALCFALFIVFRDPERIYFFSTVPRNYLTAYLGLPQPGFFSTDYFPLLPWAFLFFAGFYIYGIFRGSSLMNSLREGSSGILEWIGRHSLLLYMLHQPVIYLLLMLVFRRNLY